MKVVYDRPTPYLTVEIGSEQDFCLMKQTPPFTIFNGEANCGPVPGFPSGHASLLAGITFGCFVIQLHMLIWYLQYFTVNKKQKEFRILFVYIVDIILLLVITIIILYNTLIAVTYARSHYPSDVYVSYLLAFACQPLSILFYPQQIIIQDNQQNNSINMKQNQQLLSLES